MAAEFEEPVAAGDNGATAEEEVKSYRVHVSSRYLNLTKQKLEIARLPHELDEPKSKDWWQPKSQIEPLIDFWLEQYQWRDHEEILNRLPQFRTGFTVPQSDSPIRIQFIHVRSAHASAIPLLLIPSFPFSSLSVGHLVKLFTEPEEANHQPFHLVIPSLPGLGFSDALPTNSPVISSTADLLDSLMKRLNYPHYLVTNAGAGALSPAQVDYRLADWLATYYPDSCLGTHLISPPLTRPRARQAPLSWAKWSIARLFEAPILGYRAEDHSALRKSGGAVASSKKSTTAATTAGFGFSGVGFTEPNTLSYALCDSPTGLLVFVMKGLRLLAPKKEFTPTEIINFTQLAWLPGPEAALRFWAHCARHPEETSSNGSSSRPKKSSKKPRVALTVFLGDEIRGDVGVDVSKETKPSYSCPAWATTRYDVLYTHRADGDPGLLAWERPELIAAGVRGLAAAVLKVDRRLQSAGRPETTAGAAETGAETSAATAAATTTVPKVQEQQQDHHHQQQQQPPSPLGPSSEQRPPLESSGLLAPPKIGERLAPVREISDDTKVASSDSLAVAKTPSPIPSPVHSGPPQTVDVVVEGN
ncbi:alpha/beta-hydrolase [Xylaria castorea]|nr:alpha/beta-hydrolase [Xylaria castorea]